MYTQAPFPPHGSSLCTVYSYCRARHDWPAAPNRFLFGASYAEGSAVAGRVPTFRSASDLPVPKAKVRSGIIMIRGSYLTLGHFRKVGSDHDLIISSRQSSVRA